MDPALISLLLGAGVELVKAFEARQSGATLTDQQRALLDAAMDTSFYKLAAATGHGAGADQIIEIDEHGRVARDTSP